MPRGTIRKLRVVSLEFRAAGIGQNGSHGPGGGALAANFVVVNLAPTVNIAGAQMNLQAAIIDPLFPGALALGLVVMTWYLLRRRVSPLALLAVYLVFSILAAYPFFGPGQANSSDYSYGACTSSLLHQYTPCGAPPAPTAICCVSKPPTARSTT